VGLKIAATTLMLAGIVSAATAVPQASGRTEPEPAYSARVPGYFDFDALREFEQRVRSYLELRDRLQTGLPTLKITLFPNEIEEAETLLASRIRQARKEAREGDILAPPLETQIKHMLVVETNARTLAAIMDDNPGEFAFVLNGTYPKTRPLSTVPANLLALLPALDNGLEYRFVGRHLILRDAKANTIIDAIPYAIHCQYCIPDEDDDMEDEDN
jgi:hypothetical protein